MFSRISALVAVSLPLLALAQCNTGAVQCCQSLQAPNSTDLSTALAGSGLAGLVSISAITGDLTGLVGLVCGPLSLLTLAQTTCSTQPVCCANSFVGGLIQTGCTPINV